MKKNLLKMMLLSVMIVMSISVGAQIYGERLREGFEGEGIPEGWTMEYNSFKHDWVVEGGDLTYPTGAVSGNKRIALRNETNMTIGYKTKLVTPVIDSIFDVYQPILQFSYAQHKRGADFDTLRVYYRGAPEEEWTLLKEFDTPQAQWTFCEIDLQGYYSESYQLAFEGSDEMGRGIVLDDIVVRSAPSCLDPVGVSTPVVGLDSATIIWNRAFAVQSYDLKVSKTPLTEEQLNSEVIDLVANEVIPTRVYKYTAKNLEQGVRYYVYLKAHCEIEVSDWSEEFSFRTNTLQDLPYSEDFNIEANLNQLGFLDTWTYGSSNDSVIPPFINAGDDISNDAIKYYSPDGTYALIFSGHEEYGNNRNTPQEEKTMTYAASPLINVDDLSKVSVSFESKFEARKADRYRIIVGAMTNPLDIATFVAVDTVEVANKQENTSFFIPFTSYKGNGKYVAFKAEFENATNLFFMDNLLIEELTAAPKAHNIKVSQTTAEEATISWFFGDAKSSEIAVTNSSYVPYDGSYEIQTVSNPANGYAVKDLSVFTDYYVHVRNINGSEKSEWNTVAFKTPSKVTTILNEGVEVCDFIFNYTSAGEKGKGKCTEDATDGGVTLEDNNEYSMYVLPEIIDVANAKIEFNIGGKGSTSNPFYLEAGTMTDVHDLSTYVPLDTIRYTVGNNEFKTSRKRFSLSSFADNLKVGAFPVLMFKKDGLKFKENISAQIINDIRIYPRNICIEPTNVSVEPSDISALLTWEANGGDNWEVILSKASLEVSKDMYGNQIVTEVWDTVWLGIITGLDKTEYTFKDLEHSKVKYKVQMRSICKGETITYGDWIDEVIFETLCIRENATPYFEGFEAFSGGLPDDGETFMPCWYTVDPDQGQRVMVLNSNSTNFLDFKGFDVVLPDPLFYDGAKALCLISADAGYTWNQYVALPVMDRPVNELQVRFHVSANDIASSLEIGVMTDPYDTTSASLEVVKTFKAYKPGEYQEVVVPFKNYTGEGKHIFFRSAQGQRTAFIIDNVHVEEITCPYVKMINSNFSATTNTATVSWEKGFDETSWDIVVANKSLYVQDKLGLDTVISQSTIQVPCTPESTNMYCTHGFPSYPETVYDTTIVDILSEPRLIASEALEGDVDGVVYKAKGITSNPYTITSGLDPNTEYIFYVRASCGDGEVGEWCPMEGKFRTACDAQASNVIGEESFEGDLAVNCWVYGNLGATTVAGEIPHASEAYKHTGNKSIVMESTPFNNGAYIISPAVDVDDMDKMQVSFWATTTPDYAKTEYKQRIKVGIISNPYKLGTFTEVEEIELYADEQFYTVKFDQYDGDFSGNYGFNVMFYSEYDRANVVFIDDVRIDSIPDCAWPEGVTTGEITHNSAAISWSAGTPNYTLVLANAQMSADELNADTVAKNEKVVQRLTDLTVTAATCEDLDANATYFVYVSNDCGDNSTWSPAVRFTTDCAPTYAVPFVDDFNNYPVYETRRYPDCWTPAYTSQSTPEDYPCLVDYSGGKGLWIVTGATSYSIIALPQLDLPIAQSHLTFSAQAIDEFNSYGTLSKKPTTKNRGLVIGVSSDISTPEMMIATFEPYKTITTDGSSAAQEYDVFFTEYTGDAKNIVIMSDTTLKASDSYSNVSKYGMFIDQLSVEAIEACAAPTNVVFSSILDNSAIATWTNVATALTGVEVKVVEAAATVEDAAIFTSTLSGNTITEAEITGLNGSTTYKLFLRSTCDGAEWSDAILFTTACNKLAVGDMIDFESNHEVISDMYGKKLVMDGCFAWGNMDGEIHVPGDNTGDFFSIKENSFWGTYSRSGDYSLGVKFSQGNNDPKYFEAYVVLPLIDEDIDSVLLSFWMRPCAEDFDGNVDFGSEAAKKSYSMIVGVVESPDDMSTFQQVAEVKYSYNPAELQPSNGSGVPVSSDQSGEKYWDYKEVEFDNVDGEYIVFLNKPNGFTMNEMYIDDITINKISTCRTPQVSAMASATSADIELITETGTEWEYILSSTINISDTIANETVSETTFTIDGLNKASLYYIIVRQNCGTSEAPDWSRWSAVSMFKTVTPIRLTETFDAQSLYPAGWRRATGDIFGAMNGTGGLTAAPDVSDDGKQNNWQYSNKHVFTNGHSYVTNRTVLSSWLITPILAIESGRGDVALTFDLALTDSASSNPIQDKDIANDEMGAFTDDYFAVLISTDGGRTWEKDNATLWSQKTLIAGFETENIRSYNTIATKGEMVNLDLTKYAGQQITVAFVAQSGEQTNGAATDVHIDNININYLENNPIVATVCGGEDYYEYGFNIASSDLSVGLNEFERIVYSEGAVADTLYDLSLTVVAIQDSVINATLCEGETYTDNNFNASLEGEYKQKFVTAEGCDSTVRLNLSILKAARVELRDTICFGSEYELNGKFYTTTQMIVDTLVGKANNGCDSIITAYLFVEDRIETTVDATLCYGSSYELGDTVLTTSGQYEKTLKTASGCDSLVVVNVDALEEYNYIIERTVCEGPFSEGTLFNGITASGSYTQTGKSVDGCDSTVTLILSIIGGDTVRQDVTITTRDLPYTFKNNEGEEIGTTYDVNTKPGTYTDVINVQTDDCEGVIILNLTIKVYTSTDDANYNAFSIFPNPVEVGGDVTVTLNDNENIVSCEVYNTAGVLVNRHSTEANSIIVNDFYTEGIYMIRVTTDAGNIYTGKVLVK